MSDVTYYIYDSQWIYSHSVTLSKYDAVPRRSTMVAPPDTWGGDVGVWIGSEWRVMSKRPPVPPVPKEVPQSVTMRQCRLQLLAIGKLADVDAAIAALPEPEKSAAQIEWEYAATVERNAPLIGALGPALGLDDAQLDELFIEAAKL